MSDPDSVTKSANLFLVQIHEDVDGKGHALLINREGEIRHQFDRQAISGKQSGEDMIFLTSKNVVRVTAKDKVVWAIPFLGYEFSAGGELIDLNDGDLIASQYGCIWDSGVSLILFDPATEKEKWKAYCQPLKVPHDAYDHSAKVTVDGEKLRVTSKGSYGTFVEILELKTGRQLERTLKDR